MNEADLHVKGFRKLPDGSWGKRETGGNWLRPPEPERDSGMPLERVASRKKESSHLPEIRYRITFTVYSIRPFDWDNYRFKDLQDCIVKAGLLPGDDWRVLEGRVVPHKAATKEEERTEITIERI